MSDKMIGSLRVNLSAETAQFTEGLNRAERQLGQFGKRSGRLGKGVQLPNFSGFANGAALATGAVAGLTLAITGMRTALQFADDLDAAATKIGVTAEALQELRFAAADSDVATESLDKGLQGLNAALGAFISGVGGQRVKKAFEALGLTKDDLKNVRNAADFLPLLADRIAKLQTVAERVRIAKALGAEDLVPMLQKGSAAITEQTERARKLGIVLSDELAAKAADANRELEVMNNIISAKLKVAFADWGVQIVEAAKKLEPLIARVMEFGERSREAFSSPEFEKQFPMLAGDGVGSRTRYNFEKARASAWRRGAVLPTFEEVQADSRRGPQSRGRRRRGPKAKDLPPVTFQPDPPTKTPKTRDTTADDAWQREQARLMASLEAARTAGDIQRARALELEIDRRERIRNYQQQGLNLAAATVAAERDLVVLADARAKAQERALADHADDIALRVAQITGDQTVVDLLERKAEKQRLIVFYQEQGKSLTDAQALAEQDLAKIEAARLKTRERLRQEAQAEYQIELARARGDSEATVRRLEQAREIERRAREIVDRDGGSEADARAQAEAQVAALEDSRLQGVWRDTFKDGFQSALEGDLKGWFTNWFADRVSTAMEDGLNSIADFLFSLFRDASAQIGGGQSATGGGWMASIASWFGGGSSAASPKIPSFANEGGLRVGGAGGIDSQLVMLRASPNENVSVFKANSNTMGGGGGGALAVHVTPSPYFDVHVRQLAAEGDARVLATGAAAQAKQARRAPYRY